VEIVQAAHDREDGTTAIARVAGAPVSGQKARQTASRDPGRSNLLTLRRTTGTVQKGSAGLKTPSGGGVWLAVRRQGEGSGSLRHPTFVLL
jgi:hypothetical protein